jgi:hypothetical protein
MAKLTDTAPSATVSQAADFKSAPKKARKPSRPVYGPAEPSGTRTRAYDWMGVEIGMPEAFRSVIAWNSHSELPWVAFFDDEQNRWRSQHDDTYIDDVTDWMHYLSPAGADSGGCGEVSPNAGKARAVIEMQQLEPSRPAWTRAMPGSMPVGTSLAVMAWVSRFEFPCAATYDDEEKCWIAQQDGARLDGVTHWSYYLPPNQPSSETGGACYELAPEEIRLLQAYRESDDRAREATLGIAVRYADDWPRDWITIPAKLEEPAQRDDAPPAGVTPRSGHGEEPAPSMSAPNLDDALDRIAEESDSIDGIVATVNDILRVALHECERAGDEAAYVETIIRAARRYMEDIENSNTELQHYVSVLEGRSPVMPALVATK